MENKTNSQPKGLKGEIHFEYKDVYVDRFSSTSIPVQGGIVSRDLLKRLNESKDDLGEWVDFHARNDKVGTL